MRTVLLGGLVCFLSLLVRYHILKLVTYMSWKVQVSISVDLL